MSRLAIRLMVALAMLSTMVLAGPVAAQEEEPRIILFGAHPSPLNQTRVEAAEALQTQLDGPNLAVIRRYLLWEDDALSDPLINWTIDQGSIPLISIVPRRNDGSRVTWDEIATAPVGSAVHTELVQHATALAQIDADVWFAFQHEPETVTNISYGTDADFIAAYRRFVDEVRAAGGTNVSFLWVMTSYAFQLPSTDRRQADKWYPGDAWVDQIGADPYNWSDCREGISNTWRSWESGAVAVRDFAASRPDKGLVIAEFGSVEDPNDPDRKADWVTQIRLTLREPGWEQLTAILTFNHEQPPPDQACRWRVDTSPQSLGAYQGLINDELFGGTEGPPGVDPPTETTCTAVAQGAAALVTWENPVGVQVLRRNNSYLASVPGGQLSFTDSNPATTSSYVLRLWSGGQFQDVDCGTVEFEPAPGPTCSAVLNADSQVELTWEATPQREIVRRNNSWISSPAATATAYLDAAPADGLNAYTLRTWVGGTFTDMDCGTVDVSVPEPTCAAVLVDDVVELTWSPALAGTVVVRRNGSWVATTPAASTTWSQPAPGPGSYSYELRQWLGGSSTDYDCGQVLVP